jgi:hypothetical protein
MLRKSEWISAPVFVGAGNVVPTKISNATIQPVASRYSVGRWMYGKGYITNISSIQSHLWYGYACWTGKNVQFLVTEKETLLVSLW